MHISLRQVLALWCIVLVVPVLMQGQDLGSDSANRWLTNQKMRLTPPAYPGVTIAQIEPTRSLNITITQARVLGDSGSTGLHWRGFKYNEDNLRPLFQYNSQEYADSIVTEPIWLSANDTLSFWRMLGFVYPPNVTSEDSGLAGVRFRDSLDCIIDLIRYPTNERLLLLDSLHFIKTDSLTVWYQNLLQHAASMGNGAGVEQRHTIPSGLIGEHASIRMLIRFHGDYANRWIERDDVFTGFMSMTEDTGFVNLMGRIASALCPYIVDCDTSLFKHSSITAELLRSSMDQEFSVRCRPGHTNSDVSIAVHGRQFFDARARVYGIDGRLWSDLPARSDPHGNWNGHVSMKGASRGRYIIVITTSESILGVGAYDY